MPIITVTTTHDHHIPDAVHAMLVTYTRSVFANRIVALNMLRAWFMETYSIKLSLPDAKKYIDNLFDTVAKTAEKDHASI